MFRIFVMLVLGTTALMSMENSVEKKKNILALDLSLVDSLGRKKREADEVYDQVYKEMERIDLKSARRVSETDLTSPRYFKALEKFNSQEGQKKMIQAMERKIKSMFDFSQYE